MLHVHTCVCHIYVEFDFKIFQILFNVFHANNTGNSICCYLKLNPAYAQLRSLIIIDLKKANKSKFRL